MSRLIALYPTAWRARYELELRALLEARPPSFRDRVDLVRGALDARLHPQLLDGRAADVDMAPEGRAPGLAAVAGGLTWLVLSVVVGLAAGDRMDVDLTSLFWLALFLMTISLIGPLPAVRARQIRRGLAAWGILFGLALLLPWDLKGWSALPLVAVSAGGLLALAALRAGLSTGLRWLAVGLGFVIPFLVLGAGSMGFIDAGPASDWIQGLVIAPYGVAWVLLGILMVRRGAASGAASRSTSGPTEAIAA